MLVIDEKLAIQRFMELAKIEGPSGREAAVMQRIKQLLAEAGVAPSLLQHDDAHLHSRFGGEIGNLIVKIPGTVPGPVTLLSAHVDTVPICVGSQPLQTEDRVINTHPGSGLGADDRSGCAVLITAIAELLRSGQPHGPVTLLFCVQEEVGLYGARHLNRDQLGPVDLAFNFDGGTVEKITCGAIGGERLTIHVHGIPAHAGVAPQTGVSAINIASLAIASLWRNGWLGAVQQTGLGVGSANVGVIQGGDATNVVTPLVTVRAEARSHQALFRTKIVDAMRQAFETAASEVKNEAGQTGRVDFDSRVDYEAFELLEDDPSVARAVQAMKVVGREPFRYISNGGLDANWLYRHGIKAVTMGCGQQSIHTDQEWLHTKDFLDACRAAVWIIIHRTQDET